MRPIKFRAWHNGFKEMGYLDHLWDNHWYSTPKEPGGKPVFDNTTLWMSRHARSGIDLEVMQFTGFFDKNGKEIYEGDILSWGGSNIGAVSFVHCEFIIGENLGARTMCALHGEEDIEVIGNIYENGDLLK